MIPALQEVTVRQWGVLAWVLWYLAAAFLAAAVCAWAFGKARRTSRTLPGDDLSDVQVQVVCGFLGLAWPLLVVYGVVNGAHRLWRRVAA